MEPQIALLITRTAVYGAARSTRGPRTASRRLELPGHPGGRTLSIVIGEVLRDLGSKRHAFAAIACDSGTGRVVFSDGSTTEAASATARLRLLEELGAAQSMLIKSTAIDHPALPRPMGVAATEPEDVVRSIWRAAQDNGLRPLGVWAARAVEIEAAVGLAARGSADPTRPIVMLGEHRAIIAAGGPGAVLYVRSIDVGSHDMAKAYERAIAAARFAGADVGPAEHDAETAATLFKQHGVPQRDEPLVGSALRGIDVLPHIQPVVQRLFIEIRQTLRFGPAELSEQPAAVCLACDGQVPPRLAPALADKLEIPVEPAAQESLSGFADLVLNALMQGNLRSPRLEPDEIRQRRKAVSRYRVVGSGIAAAVALLAVDATVTTRTLRAVERDYAIVSHDVIDAEDRLAALNDDERLAGLLTFAAEQTRDRVFTRMPWAAALNTIDEAAGDDIRLIEAAGTHRNGEGFFELVAITHGEGANAEPRIRGFMTAIQHAAAARSVSLISATADRGRSLPSTRFTLRIHLAGVHRAPPAIVLEPTP